MFLVLGITPCLAQTGSYRALSKTAKEVGVVGATVIALDQDSIALGVTTTDAEESLASAKWSTLCCISTCAEMCRLEPKALPVIYLEEQEELLGEVVVQVERPLVKLLEGGILQYDVALLSRRPWLLLLG